MRVSMRAYLLAACLLLASCSDNGEKEAIKAQTFLNDAELAMAKAEYPTAIEKAQDTIRLLEGVVKDYADNNEAKLLLPRARIILFRACFTNKILENNSLPLEEVGYVYKDVAYAGTIGKALPELEAALAIKDLEGERKAAVYAYKATCQRFLLTTSPAATESLDASIACYRAVLATLEKDAKANTNRILRIKEYIHRNQLAKVQNYMVLKSYEPALALLESEEFALGRDLTYFRSQISALRAAMRDIEARREASKSSWGGSLDGGMADFNKEKRKENIDKAIRAFADQIQIKQAELDALLQQLCYRILCYHYLNITDSEKTARDILKENYPEMDAALKF